MDILDALEEIKDANARSSKVDVDAILQKSTELSQLSEESIRAMYYEAHDDAMAKALFSGSRGQKVCGGFN